MLRRARRRGLNAPSPAATASLAIGGWRFILQMGRWNAIVAAAPRWVAAALMPAALLGLGGTVVIAHGASTARAVTAACALAANLTRGDITEKIKERIGITEARRPTHFLRRDR